MFVYQKTGPGQYIVSVDPREELLFEALCIELRYDIDHAFGTPTSEDIYRSSSSLTSPSPSSRSPGYSADDEKEDDVDSPKPQLVADNSTYSQALDAGVDVPGSDSYRTAPSSAANKPPRPKPKPVPGRPTHSHPVPGEDNYHESSTATEADNVVPCSGLPTPALISDDKKPPRPRPRSVPGGPTYSLSRSPNTRLESVEE